MGNRELRIVCMRPVVGGMHGLAKEQNLLLVPLQRHLLRSISTCCRHVNIDGNKDQNK